MLIPIHIVDTILETYNIARKGILHVGAHNCEEMQVYNTLGFESNQIVWIDANPEKTSENLARGIPNCYTAVLDETVGEKSFKITNNGQSSSLLDFGTYALSYNYVVVVETLKVQTERLSDFLKKRHLILQIIIFGTLIFKEVNFMYLEVLRKS